MKLKTEIEKWNDTNEKVSVVISIIFKVLQQKFGKKPQQICVLLILEVTKNFSFHLSSKHMVDRAILEYE